MGASARPTIDPAEQAWEAAQRSSVSHDPAEAAWEAAQKSGDQPLRLRVKGALKEMVQHPFRTAGSIIKAPVEAAAKGAEFVGQTAAEMSLPADVRAKAYEDPDRISEEDAALAGIQVALPAVIGPASSRVAAAISRPVASAVSRTAVATAGSAATGAAYSPEDPAVGATIGAGLSLAHAGVAEAYRRGRAVPTAAATPPAETPAPRQPITDKSRLLPAAGKTGPQPSEQYEGPAGPPIPTPAPGVAEAMRQARETEEISATPKDIADYQRRRDLGQGAPPVRGPQGTLRRPGVPSPDLFSPPERLRVPARELTADEEARLEREAIQNEGTDQIEEIPDIQKAQLGRLGYSKADIASLRPADAMKIVTEGTKAPAKSGPKLRTTVSTAQPEVAGLPKNVYDSLIRQGYDDRAIRNMHPENAKWLAEEDGVTSEPEPERDVSRSGARTKSGALKDNLATVHVDDLGRELARLYNEGQQDQGFADAFESDPQVLQRKETLAGGSASGSMKEDAAGFVNDRGERIGDIGREAGQARARTNARQASIQKIEQEFARRGIDPVDALMRASGGDIEERHAGLPFGTKQQAAVRDFVSTMFSDPFAAARRADPELAGLADEALAARTYAAHFARTAAATADKGLSPEESVALTRLQQVGRLKQIGQQEASDLFGAHEVDARRTRTIARLEAQIPNGFADDPKIKAALARRMALYRDVLEPAALEANVPASNFSRSPTGHIKLLPTPAAGTEQAEPSGRSFGGTRTARAAQKTQGTAFDYETDYRKLLETDARDKFVVAAQNRLYSAIAERVREGRYREVRPNQVVAPNELKVTVRDPADIIDNPDGRQFTVAMPKDEANVVRHVHKVLNELRNPTNDVASAMRVADQLAGRAVFTMNPAALVSHTRNMAAAVGSVPELGPKGWERAATSMLPAAKQLRGLGEILSLDMEDRRAQDVKMRLAKMGALRPIDRPVTGFEERIESKVKAGIQSMMNQLSPDMREQLAKLTVFGRDGIDERARTKLAMKYLSVKPDATDAEIGRYVNRLAGNYTRGMGGVLVDALQNAKLAMFARIETAKIGLGARTLVGKSLLPASSGAQAAELRIKQLMQGPIGSRTGEAAIAGAIGATAAAPGHEGDLPTGEKDKTGRDILIRGKFLNPTDEAALQDLAIDAARRGDAKAVKQILRNTALRIGTSHPFTRALFALYGVEPQVDRDGRLRPVGEPNLSGAVRAKDVGNAALSLTSLRPFAATTEPNPGLPSPVGRALSWIGANVTTTSQPAANIAASLQRHDAASFRDDVTRAIAQEKDFKRRIEIARDARRQMQEASEKDPAIGQALLRARVERAIMRAVGRP